MDISALSLAELRELSNKVQDQIKVVQSQSLAAAQQQIRDIASNLGMSVNDLMQQQTRAYKKSGPVPAKYRDPADAANEWSGRGRKPKWLTAYIDSGRDITEFAL